MEPMRIEVTPEFKNWPDGLKGCTDAREYWPASGVWPKEIQAITAS
jgi:hypothetical protein